MRIFSLPVALLTLRLLLVSVWSQEMQETALKEYSIYVETRNPPSVKQAAKRLQLLIGKASGCQLPIREKPCPPFIAVGVSEATFKAGINAESLGYDGYILRKVGNNIFIVGRDMPEDGNTPDYGKSFGTSFGVNAFLEHSLGIHWLLAGEKGLHLPKLDGEFRFGNVDECYVPRFTYRLLRATEGSSPKVEEWLAFNQMDRSCDGSRNVQTTHIWQFLYPQAGAREAEFLLDRDRTFQEHPDFFELAKDGRRVPPPPGEIFSLCLGNPATTEDIIQRIPRLSEAWAARTPSLQGMKIMSLSPNDNAPYCACEQCLKYRRKVTPELTGGPVSYDLYFSWTELVFNHIRTVCNRLPDYTFSCHIYHSTQFPYPGIQPMPRNFVASMAPIHCAYGPVRLCDSINATWHHWMRSWRGVFADEIYFGLDFWLRQYYGAPLPSCIGLIKDTFEEFRHHSISGGQFFDNAGFGQSGLTMWVLAKMLWNPDLNPEKLAADYLRLAYGEKAADFMARLHQAVDDQARLYYNGVNGRSGWDLDAEVLAGLYAPIYPQLEKLYLDAVSAGGDDNQRWRLAMFGENLKLLRHTLVFLNLLEDSPSPLRLGDAGYDRLSLARMPGGEMTDYVGRPILANAAAIGAQVSCEVTEELQGRL